MDFRKFFTSCLTIAVATSPVQAINLPIIFIPMGHWEFEEKIFVKYNINQPTPTTDTGSNFVSMPCYGFSITSSRQRLSGGLADDDAFCTLDLGIESAEEPNGFRVKWTWVPPVQNPNQPASSFNVISTAYSSVSVLEGSSPSEITNVFVAGATAAVVGSPSSTSKTYGNGQGTYSGTPGTLVENVSIHGQRTSKVDAHTVAYITGPSQHFTASAWLTWGFQ